jgi:GH15 family glucan-1,4-alpha-glucosidase
MAMRRGQQLARRFADTKLAEACGKEADLIRADILQNGLDKTGHHFVGTYGGDEPDGALLRLPVVGAFRPDEPLVRNTVEWLHAELRAGHFLYRYRGHDGLQGPEGAFVLCGFWLSEALAMSKRIEEAEAVFVTHAEAANHLGLLSEEVHPFTHLALGNFPQAFSHLGLINAAARIDLALRMRDEGETFTPLFFDPEPAPIRPEEGT